MFRSTLLITAAPFVIGAAAPATTPHPGELKTFKDWATGCDNTKRCTLASLGPSGGALPDVAMGVVRDAGPDGALRISLLPIDGAARPAGLAIDGKRVGGAFKSGNGGVFLDGAGAAAVAGVLANSRTLAVVDDGGKTIAALSPIGLAAALRYIDAAQGRDGGITAIVAKGAKPSTVVPAAPILPSIIAVTPAGKVARPSNAQIAALAKSAKCERDAGAAKAESYALGTGMALVIVPCSSGAYNLSSAVFVIEHGKPRPARFDASPGFGEAMLVPMVVNADYKAGALTSYMKARGLGDCGVSQSFVWDGVKFRLSKQAEMGECRGNPNFITTWRARVTRP